MKKFNTITGTGPYRTYSQQTEKQKTPTTADLLLRRVPTSQKKANKDIHDAIMGKQHIKLKL